MAEFEPIPSELNDLTERVIRCAIAVHRELGPGMLESVYRRAMCLEMRANSLTFEAEKAVPVIYRDTCVGTHRLNLVVAGKIVVELKSIQMIDFVHRIQVLSYLRASKLRVGLLINFNVAVLRHGIRRLAL